MHEGRWDMEELIRERRLAELRGLQVSNPRSLIDRYCEITAQAPSSQLPHGISFSRMIDTIVEHEVASEKSPVATN